MKKIFFVFAVMMVAVAARAESFTYVVHTSDCRPAAMHALMDRISAENRAVIAKVVCDAPQMERQVSYANYDMSAIPVVDCVPGPIVTSCGC